MSVALSDARRRQWARMSPAQREERAPGLLERLARTLAAASSLDKGLREKLKNGADTAAAGEVGKLVAERAIAAGVSEVVFDRGRYLYHGRVKALADGAREGGLKF